MAFFCPIFGSRYNKAIEYEDSEYFSSDQPKSLCPSRSLSALHGGLVIDGVIVRQLTNDDVVKPNTKILITNNFEPTVNDEVGVRSGDTVTAMYKDHDWVFVKRDDDGREGFVPLMYCSTRTSNKKLSDGSESDASSSERRKSASNKFRFGSARSRSLGRKTKSVVKACESSPKPQMSARPTSPKALENINRFLQSLNETNSSSGDGARNYESELEVDRTKNEIIVRKCPIVAMSSSSSVQSSERSSTADCFSSTTDGTVQNKMATSPFVKKPSGYYLALFRFDAMAEDDLSVDAGDILLILNQEDPDWFWIRAPSGSEGFVPSNYIVPYETDRISLRKLNAKNEPLENCFNTNGNRNTRDSNGNTMSLTRGCELLITKDVVPEASDDLQLKKGDWVFSCQNLDSLPSDNVVWLWVYCPRTQRYGFVRRSSTQLPAATVL